jgi:protein tyrosine/serine phosphatase
VRQRRALRWAALVVGVVALVAVVKYGRHHVIAKRFATVVPGELYRSGYLEPWPLRRVIENHHIRTVVTLLDDEPDQQPEKNVLAEEGVELVRIPMPGDGRGDFDALDRAADAIADESKRPMLVHCAAGVNRTSAAYVAWRVKHCGWSLDEALDEVADYGITPDRRPGLVDHLRRYYETRVKHPATQPVKK